LEDSSAPPPPRPASRTASTPPGGLSLREIEVAALVAQGLTNRQIAERLVISEWTVVSHVRHILDKRDVRSRTQIGAWASEHGLRLPDQG
jgi:DNA-binding NarL/FixJ family response regulator